VIYEKTFLLVTACCCTVVVFSTSCKPRENTLSTVEQSDNRAKMEWFADAKLGIFIHWGVYSTGNTTESWAFFNKEISHEDYMAQLDSFTAATMTRPTGLS
jgi:alpha-L-fucosidase